MSRLSISRIHGGWLLLGSGVLLALLLVLSAVSLVQRNVRNLAGLDRALTTQVRDAPVVSAGCPAYLDVIVALQDESIPVSRRVVAGQQALFCLSPARRQMASLMLARLHAREGNVQEACSLLEPLQAGEEVIHLAGRAAAADDFTALDGYVGCLSAMNISPTRMSAWQASRLSDLLGAHLETESGREAEALAAYRQAIAWSPDFGPRPYLGVARILGAQEGPSAGSRFLASVLVDGPIPDDLSFYLWRALGLSLESEGRLPEAYCALDRALKLADGLSPDLAPESWRVEMVARLRDIEPNIWSVASRCDGLIRTLAEERAETS